MPSGPSRAVPARRGAVVPAEQRPPRFACMYKLLNSAMTCPARLQRKSAAEGHFYSPGVSPPFTPGGVELGRLGGCGAGVRVATLLVGRPKTAPALGRVDFVPGVVLGGHLALTPPPPPYAQFPSFGRPAGRTRGWKGTTAAASSAEQGEWTPCEPSSPSQPSKVTSRPIPSLSTTPPHPFNRLRRRHSARRSRRRPCGRRISRPVGGWWAYAPW